jgi:hypothetical protein
MQSNRGMWLSVLAMVGGVVACGGGAKSHRLPWGDKTPDVIVTGEAAATTESAVDGDGCLVSHQDACVSYDHGCDGVLGDVYLSTSGDVLEYVCYPAEDTLTVEEVSEQQGDIAQNQNGVVIVLDDTSDGVDLAGDLSVDANRVVVYGEGPDVSVIRGNVDVDGNQIFVRGVRIQGDVHVGKNGALFANCVIEGDLVIEGNNTELIACDVFGKVTNQGNNTKLLGSRFVHVPEVTGKNTVCEDSFHITDKDMDLLVDDGEVGASICP